MVDIIDEVNEDLRRERFNQFWQRVGVYVIAASVVIVVATVSTVLWQNYSANRQLEASEAFLAADATLKARDYDSAARQFSALAEKNAEGIPTLAAMKAAHANSLAGGDAAALEIYRKVMDDNAADKGFRHMARIYAAQILMKQDAAMEDITAVLKPLTGDKDNAFSPIAREQLAFAALANDDDATARRLLAELASDMSAPITLRRRAQAQAASIGAPVVDGDTVSQQ